MTRKFTSASQKRNPGGDDNDFGFLLKRAAPIGAIE